MGEVQPFVLTPLLDAHMMPTPEPNAPYLAQIRDTKTLLRDQMPDRVERYAWMSARIKRQIDAIAAERANGVSPIPSVDFAELDGMDDRQRERIRERGCVIVRGVFDPARVAAWNDEITAYLQQNDYEKKSVSKRGLDQYFSALSSARPQIFATYWSPPQMLARQSEELALTRRWLNRLWNPTHQGSDLFNADLERTYADRVRMREPGDATLGLSPHVDGGSIERWIDPGYRQVYDAVYRGDIARYRAFDAAGRPEAREIPSPAVCRMFRTFQGWTALTAQGPGDGTLNVVPVADAMAWMLLRALQDDVADDDLCGARAGRAMVVSQKHHALLLNAYGPIPKVQPGDTVWWHPDVIHGVEDRHAGTGYSNVMYIGSAPDCAKNRTFSRLQRPAFESGLSSPDFAAENYEVDFAGRFTPDQLSPLGRLQMGYDLA